VRQNYVLLGHIIHSSELSSTLHGFQNTVSINAHTPLTISFMSKCNEVSPLLWIKVTIMFTITYNRLTCRHV